MTALLATPGIMLAMAYAVGGFTIYLQALRA
jgi:hypothetical protein